MVGRIKFRGSASTMHALPFDFVGVHHPFFEVVGRLRALIAAYARKSGDLAEVTPMRMTIHTEIKARRTNDARWTLDRFYWSSQLPDAAQPFGVRADTLSYDAKSARPVWHTFPSDPYLTFMQEYAGSGMADERARLLRYVPLRRVTFREDDSIGGARIGKFKRRSRFREAYHMLGVVADAVLRSGAPFKVATPLQLIEQNALYYQSVLDGVDVADLIGPAAGPVLLARIGEIHRLLHGVDVPGLPAVSNVAWLEKTIEDLDLIGLYFPEARARLVHVPALLRRVAPTDRGFTFCHGDFVCSQLLLAGEQWSITDFDLACFADPYRDVAMFISSLAYDVPYVERARSTETGKALACAYVDGYFGAALKADAKRFRRGAVRCSSGVSTRIERRAGSCVRIVACRRLLNGPW
jgi:Phosphotransferase enzyme family